MKITGVFSKVFLLLLVACVAADVPGLTPDTVEGELDEGMPESWGLTGSAPEDYEVYVDRKNVHGGTAAVTLLSYQTTENRFAALVQDVETGEYAGSRVRFSAYVRTNRVQQSSGLWVRADSKSRASVAFDNMDDRRIVGSTDWQRYEIVVDIPEDAVVVRYGLILEGTGQVWLDDCRLEIAGGDARTTGQFGLSYPKEYQPSSKLCSMPTNMDFEGGIVRN